jgi:type I restriction enzyme S subunit
MSKFFKTIPLKNTASYSKKRIESFLLNSQNYIGTDNLLQNKKGKVDGNYTPEKGLVCRYDKGDILISNIRPYLRKIWYANNTGGSSADVLTLVINQHYDSKFLYYSLFRDEFFEYMMTGSKGTKMPRGDKTQVMSFPIPDFKLQDQQKIASVLSTLDSKIELNNKINAELEQMAKTSYDYWFVQFDFPVPKNSPLEGWQVLPDGVEETKPYKTSGGAMVYNQELKRHIPKGWEVKKISDLLPVITGKQDANFATENGEYNFFTCGEEILKCNSYEFEGKAVLIAGNGNFGIKLYEGKFNAYQRTYILMPNNEKHYTIIYLAVKDKIQSFKNSSRGSIIKFITKGDIENILIPLPKDKDLYVFTQLNNITEKIEKNLEENQKLAELRDFLLPMLMNGQVVVE